MTKEEFQNLKVGDTVAINGITGKVTEKDDATFVLKSKHFDCGDGMDEVCFAWNEGNVR